MRRLSLSVVAIAAGIPTLDTDVKRGRFRDASAQRNRDAKHAVGVRPRGLAEGVGREYELECEIGLDALPLQSLRHACLRLVPTCVVVLDDDRALVQARNPDGDD